MPTLTDLSTIRDLCARYDFALSKGFGQNFIINPGICPRIAEAAGIGPGWGALEVGPGIGVLTEQLCKRADNVVSIEVDKRLPPLLEETMADYDNFKLVLNDVSSRSISRPCWPRSSAASPSPSAPTCRTTSPARF